MPVKLEEWQRTHMESICASLKIAVPFLFFFSKDVMLTTRTFENKSV
jgi:hypothetical protein